VDSPCIGDGSEGLELWLGLLMLLPTLLVVVVVLLLLLLLQLLVLLLLLVFSGSGSFDSPKEPLDRFRDFLLSSRSNGRSVSHLRDSLCAQEGSSPGVGGWLVFRRACVL